MTPPCTSLLFASGVCAILDTTDHQVRSSVSPKYPSINLISLVTAIHQGTIVSRCEYYNRPLVGLPAVIRFLLHILGRAISYT